MAMHAVGAATCPRDLRTMTTSSGSRLVDLPVLLESPVHDAVHRDAMAVEDFAILGTASCPPPLSHQAFVSEQLVDPGLYLATLTSNVEHVLPPSVRPVELFAPLVAHEIGGEYLFQTAEVVITRDCSSEPAD